MERLSPFAACTNNATVQANLLNLKTTLSNEAISVPTRHLVYTRVRAGRLAGVACELRVMHALELRACALEPPSRSRGYRVPDSVYQAADNATQTCSTAHPVYQ